MWFKSWNQGQTLMRPLIWSEVFVWISARLRFHKKIFWIDIESEISKVKINFSVKSVRVLKCLHNFITRQQIWWSDTSEKLGTTNVFWNFYSVWSFSTCYFTFFWLKSCSQWLLVLIKYFSPFECNYLTACFLVTSIKVRYFGKTAKKLKNLVEKNVQYVEKWSYKYRGNLIYDQREKHNQIWTDIENIRLLHT